MANVRDRRRKDHLQRLSISQRIEARETERAPIDKGTFFVDETSDVSKANAYKVREFLNGKEGKGRKASCILRTTDNRELRIFTTTIPTEYRFPTFMHDPQYRLSIAWQNVAYNQPPHTSFYIGDDMARPPRPRIRYTRK